uniref:6-phosphogluconolactonase n=1 Tax=mine drainage metagenome TaxID=410659 RepID=E6QM50_9ZZZZ
MKFSKFGKTALAAALGTAMTFSLSSCIYSFTVGYLYVTGTQTATPAGSGIISAYGIDNDTGKLIELHGFPMGSGGANPGRTVLVDGSRFVYVLNQGTPANGSMPCNASNPCANSNITEFVVGGNGILTPQETFFTQGNNPFRLVADSSGNYLLALDHDAPSKQFCNAVATGATSCGDITVFKIDTTTGRLTLVDNAQLTASTGSQVTYFPVPANPVDFAITPGYVMTVSGATGVSGGQVAYPYTYNSSTGQLVVSQNVPQVLNSGSGATMEAATAIIYSGSKVYVLDNEPLTATANGVTITSPSQIVPFTIGTNGALQSLTGGAVQDDPTETSPIYLITDSKNRFVYVANQFGASQATGSGITGYTIDPASALLTETPGSPWGTGANPQCLVEDSSNQYIYTANANDSTITGRVLDPNSGSLNPMNGSTGVFAVAGPPAWCWIDGRTN